MAETDLKSFNAAVNDRIQELAVKAVDTNHRISRRDMNDLMSLLIPKLRFYIWGFMPAKDDTDDVLHNALEKIYVGISTYNKAYRFTTWAFSIARNEALTWLNKVPGNFVNVEDYFHVIANTMVDDGLEILENEEKREAVLVDVYEEIQRVSIDEENLMLLEADINHRKGKDIAERYEMCENSVKTRIRAGRKKVRDAVLVKHPELKIKITILDL